MQQAMPEKTDGQPPIERIAYSTREAAEAMGVSEATIYRLISRRQLCASRKLRHKRILKSEIERFLRDEPNPRRSRANASRNLDGTA